MAKSREDKVKIVKSILEKIDKAKSVVFVNYKGLSVAETEELRNNLRKSVGDFGVIKNSLLKIALREKKLKVDNEMMDKPLALAVSYKDEVSSAKEVVNYSKDHHNLEVVGGLMGDEYIDESRVRSLAALPSLEELYAKVVGSVSAPLSGMVNVLTGNVRGLVNVLNQYKETIK